MKIFNIIVILSISDKEVFHFDTFRPSNKNKKKLFQLGNIGATKKGARGGLNSRPVQQKNIFL